MEYKIKNDKVVRARYSPVTTSELQQDIDRMYIMIDELKAAIVIIDELNATLPGEGEEK